MTEANSLSFDCVINGKRCSKCCEVIHVSKDAGEIVRGTSKIGSLRSDDEPARHHWKPMSKRRAKNKNPYMFGAGWPGHAKNWLRKSAAFFSCTALAEGVCSIYDDRPNICREFSGSGMYAYECAQESYEKSQIIATDAADGS